MEIILPGLCGSLLPALVLLPASAYVDNVFASLIRVLRGHRGQRRVEGRIG